MTSRELTSGFDIWSRGHFCMAVMHLPMKFGADSFIQSGVIDIFPKLKMAAAVILDLFGWTVGPLTKRHSWCVPPVKICHDLLGSFQVIRIWIFLFRLESPIHVPKISVFGGFYTQNLGAHSSDPQKVLPCAERRVLSPHWSRCNAQCDLLAKKTKKGKKDHGKLAIRPDHPRCRTEIKVCMPGGLRCVVFYISSFIKIGSVVLPLWVVENRSSLLLWPLAYTTATTVQAVIYYYAMQIFILTSIACTKGQGEPGPLAQSSTPKN